MFSVLCPSLSRLGRQAYWIIGGGPHSTTRTSLDGAGRWSLIMSWFTNPVLYLQSGGERDLSTLNFIAHLDQAVSQFPSLLLLWHSCPGYVQPQLGNASCISSGYTPTYDGSVTRYVYDYAQTRWSSFCQSRVLRRKRKPLVFREDSIFNWGSI